ncbi:MAG TPA: anion transporter [Lentisphaeria bacterium]|nr:anion transporter [Lentisphaeria bacterium]
MISIIVLFLVFVLIAVRQIGKIKLQIWQIMLLGAITVLITGRIPINNAFKSINLDVMLFLFGMFVIGKAMESSGYLSHLTYRFFKKTKTDNALLIAILFGFGFLSALLMNDTLSIVGAPVMLLLAKKHNIHAKVLLLALAFSVTIGSVMSPIGNPQNLLIAIHGNISNPFVLFLKYLFIPTIINLFSVYFLLKLFYKEHFRGRIIDHSQEPIRNRNLAFLSKISLMLVLILIILKIVFVFFVPVFQFQLTYIALIGMLPIIIFSKKRIEIVRHIDWYTLIFFASMFILMESVWISGVFQAILKEMNFEITSLPSILMMSIILSQLISNVPMVALYMPLLIKAGASSKALIALAAGSTIAGNLLILGAASNIIIIQNAEMRSKETITFLDFAKIGIPLTIINAFVYYIFLVIIP